MPGRYVSGIGFPMEIGPNWTYDYRTATQGGGNSFSRELREGLKTFDMQQARLKIPYAFINDSSGAGAFIT